MIQLKEEQSPLTLAPIEHSPLSFMASVSPSQPSATNSPESIPLPHSAPSSQSPEAIAAHLPGQRTPTASPYTMPASAPAMNHHEMSYSPQFVSPTVYHHHDPYEGSSVATFTASSVPPTTSYATSVDYQASSTEYEDSPSPEITTASNLSALYASAGHLFQPLFSQVFSPQNAIEAASSSDANEEEAHISTANWQVNIPHIPQSHQAQYHVPLSPSDTIPGPNNLSNIMEGIPTYSFPEVKMFREPSGRVAAAGDIRHHSPWPDDPPAEETQHYMYLFFSTFTRELPIVHPHTFRYEGKSEVLLRVLQACGALYVRTKKASRFIANTLTAVKQIFLHEFSKNVTDVEKQAHLVLAVCLIQTIGLFHERSDLRAASNLYHASKVAMLRRTGLFAVNGSWRPSTQEHVTVDMLWRDWANHEVMKRSLLLSYMHDNINNIYFALPATYSLSEVAIHLPCEDRLWDARNGEEWFNVLQKPSPYGSYTERQIGVNFHKAIQSIGQTHTLLNPYMVTPFGHFVIIHAFLAQLFCFCVEDRMPPDPASPPKPNIQALTYRMQYSLFNWYKSWEASPDMPRPGPNEEPLFSHHALQYYWLGQIALLAHQEGLPPFENGSPQNLEVDFRYSLVKVWLKHIRKFLCRPGAEPTKLWQEMMAIRLKAQGEDGDIPNVEDMDDGGILSFWPEH